MDAPTLRAILARNLQRLREHHSPPDRVLSVRAWAMGRELEVRLIDRLLKGEYDPKLDTVVEVAHKLGLQPWQLLLEDFDPAHPQSMPMTEDERKTLENLRRLLAKES